MKIFHCSHCDHLVFFESVQCVNCGHGLAYSPSERRMVAFAGDPGETPGAPSGAPSGAPQAPAAEAARGPRLCQNYSLRHVCNWMIDDDDESIYCLSCRLTPVVPNLSSADTIERWSRAEAAKRRLIVQLLSLGLPMLPSTPDGDDGLTFEFKESQPGAPVLTGHLGGTITLNVREADDVERERLRTKFDEPYRTLLGHLRHESGHYYWDRLVRDSERLDAWRERFGDETLDYGAALRGYYANGARPGWQSEFVSAYASSHPWEDWAETWAHYLHLTDTLETARACGLMLRPKRTDEPVLAASGAGEDIMRESFDTLVASWHPVTYLLNNLNRGLGLPDGYPFVISAAVKDKLRLVHETIVQARSARLAELAPPRAKAAA